MDDFMSFVGEVAAPITGMLLVLFVVVATLIGVAEKVGAQSFPARVTVVREAIARLGCNASEDVVGTAVQINRDIADRHYWNGTVLAAWAPNEIANETPIAIPECK